MKKLFIIIGVILIAFILFSSSLYRLYPYWSGSLREESNHTDIDKERQETVGNQLEATKSRT